MTSRTPIVITLGDRSFTIPPCTLGQVEKIEAALAADKPILSKSIDVIQAALPAPVDVRTVTATADELTAAFSAILRFAGFVADATSGEEPAAAKSNANDGGATSAAA